MATSTNTADCTPPHHPTFQVHLRADQISGIVRQCLPDYQLLSFEQLQSGKSYNNRIYYLDVEALPSNSTLSSFARTQKLVIKVNGRFFGSAKVRNEVACLRLLETYCPNIPSPRVVAWSEGGRTETAESRIATEASKTLASVRLAAQADWILMTRVPGEPISTMQLSSEEIPQVIAQLAGYVADWRTNIPRQPLCGNVCPGAKNDGSTYPNLTVRDPDFANLGFSIGGLIGEDLFPVKPIATLADYFKVRILDRINRLRNNEVFRRNWAILDSLTAFAENDLPSLKLISAKLDSSIVSSPFLFTHYDLSPRNILVSGYPPRVTGIVDFEFAGFFSQHEEFVNDKINNEGDWSDETYQMYMDNLERNGVDSPLHGFEKVSWTQHVMLEELIQHIAPWWLPGPHSGAALEDKLQEAELLIKNRLQSLLVSNARETRV